MRAEPLSPKFRPLGWLRAARNRAAGRPTYAVRVAAPRRVPRLRRLGRAHLRRSRPRPLDPQQPHPPAGRVRRPRAPAVPARGRARPGVPLDRRGDRHAPCPGRVPRAALRSGPDRPAPRRPRRGSATSTAPTTRSSPTSRREACIPPPRAPSKPGTEGSARMTDQPEGRLAIVTSVVGKSTEISQRRHINELFGGETAIVCYSVEPGFVTDKPMLHVTRRPPGLVPRLELEFGKALQHAHPPRLRRPLRRGAAARRDLPARAEGLRDPRRVRPSRLQLRADRRRPRHPGLRLLPRLRRLETAVLAAARDVLQGGDPAASPAISRSRSRCSTTSRPRASAIPTATSSRAASTRGCSRRADKDPDLLLAVGRMIPKKAPLTTIEAFARVAADFPSRRLEMIGDGPLLEDARRLAAERGLADRVAFLGLQPHPVVREKMARAAVFLQHSVTDADGNEEGLPIAIQEAMASGAVVISTRHAGIPDAVVERRDRPAGRRARPRRLHRRAARRPRRRRPARPPRRRRPPARRDRVRHPRAAGPAGGDHRRRGPQARRIAPAAAAAPLRVSVRLETLSGRRGAPPTGGEKTPCGPQAAPCSGPPPAPRSRTGDGAASARLQRAASAPAKLARPRRGAWLRPKRPIRSRGSRPLPVFR